MKKILLLGLILGLSCVASFSFAESTNAEFQQVLDSKCSQCHTKFRIEEAIARGADMDQIIAKMIRLGARLDENDRQVMGVFWTAENQPENNQTEASKMTSVDPLREYRAVLQSRCTGCHTLEIVEKAMAEGRSVAELVDEMRKRGAIITPADKSVLGTFWGNPLKADSK